MYQTWAAVFVAAVATCSAQSSKQLTARELFFVPTGASITRTEAPKPKAPTANKTTTPPVQVAKAQPPKKAPTTAGAPPVITPPPQHQMSSPTGEATIQIVSASYSGPRPLGLRYSILKRDPSGDWAEVNTDTTFHSGDKIRVRVESNEAAHLYIVAKGSSGSWDVLFPNKDINGGDNRVEAGAEEILPNRRGQWTFDNNKGEERLFLVLSRKPVADLDTLIYDLNKPGAATPAKSPDGKKANPPQLIYASRSPINDKLVGDLRNQMQARDLVFEKVDDKVEDRATHRKESAAYVVEKSGAPDARLVADIRLLHD